MNSIFVYVNIKNKNSLIDKKITTLLEVLIKFLYNDIEGFLKKSETLYRFIK